MTSSDDVVIDVNSDEIDGGHQLKMARLCAALWRDLDIVGDPLGQCRLSCQLADQYIDLQPVTGVTSSQPYLKTVSARMTVSW